MKRNFIIILTENNTSAFFSFKKSSIIKLNKSLCVCFFFFLARCQIINPPLSTFIFNKIINIEEQFIVWNFRWFGGLFCELILLVHRQKDKIKWTTGKNDTWTWLLKISVIFPLLRKYFTTTKKYLQTFSNKNQSDFMFDVLDNSKFNLIIKG